VRTPALDREGHFYCRSVGSAVVRPQTRHPDEVVAQILSELCRQDRDAIVGTLPAASRNLAAVAVQILDPKPHAFHQPHTGIVQQIN
jgi:hypothetical protein